MTEGTAKYVHRKVTTTFSVWCDTDAEVEAAKKMSVEDFVNEASCDDHIYDYIYEFVGESEEEEIRL
jgi:hypothetical protein